MAGGLTDEVRAEIATHVPGASRATGRLSAFGYDANSKAIFRIVQRLLAEAWREGVASADYDHETSSIYPVTHNPYEEA